ncbi:MAG: protein-glutamate O-methyltransferase CheR [Candidatus Bathyarchaeota archaeon]|nr:protein-glutamate O-methyltransferase CheR [Candidatus Bathyarchaeota archaeon]
MATVETKNFLEDIAYEKVKNLLHETIGLNFSCYRDEYLKRRLSIRLRATGTYTFSKYLGYLKKNPIEFNNILNDLTINFTTFFRDRDVYDYLEKRVLPVLFNSKEVAIWSAGCATGEEPYSLAILVHKVLGDQLPNYKVTIYASDIDEDALTKAQKGEYTKKQLCDVEDSLIKEYFSHEYTTYRIKDFVKQLVRFEKHDLMKPPLHNNLDLILCRNVMIFFARESQQHVHMHFYNALREGGYLVTGKSEILSGEPCAKFLCIDVNCRVYQKPSKDSSPTSEYRLGVAQVDTLSLNNLTGGQGTIVRR